MGSGFDAERAERVRCFDFERCGLQACFFGVGSVHHGGGVPVAFGPAKVHAHEHFGEVCGVDAAGPCPDGHHGFAFVVFSGKQGHYFEVLQGLPDGFQFCGGFAHGVGVVLVLAELDKHFQVVDPRHEPVQPLQLGLAVREA